MTSALYRKQRSHIAEQVFASAHFATKILPHSDETRDEAVGLWIAATLRAGMTASRLDHRRHVIPAPTDHLEEKAG